MSSDNESDNPASSDDLNTGENTGSLKGSETSVESSASESSSASEANYVPEQDNLEKMILSTGIRVGTPVKTKYMVPFIIRANPEGLYILDISKTLSRIDIAAKFISRADISKVAVTSAREYGKTPVERFCNLTHAKYILGRFMPGTFTNPALPKYMEPQIVIVTDPQADQQAVLEATRAGVPVIAICNSDNVTSKVDVVIPANNRGRKALATVYWLLAREVLKKQGVIKTDSEMKVPIEDFETKLVEELS
ncbi:MAG: 30S ribosomal protein S2 [Nitrososphaeraceae archaeon]|jgi:small subunit ribosomal protein S2